MKPLLKPLHALAVTLLCAALLALSPLLAQKPLPVSRASADKQYAEKSYALALPQYQALLKRMPPKSPDRALIEYRIAVALGASQKWDEALVAWDKFLAAHVEEPLWAARGHYQRGLLLNTLPHQGYKVGTRIYRGNEYPHTTEAKKPEYVGLYQDDAKDALKDFEAAVLAYDQVGKPVTPSVLDDSIMPSASDKLAAEKTDLYFDLAKFLPNVQSWGSADDWKAAKTTDWTINPSQPYGVKWPQPKKILFLLARIPRFNPTNTHNIVLTDMAWGLYVANWHNAWARTEFVKPAGKPGAWQIVQTLPYFKLDPMAILTHAADSYPRDPQAPQIRLILAQWTEHAGDFVGALKLYRLLFALYPSSHWAPDALAAAQEIVRKTVGLSTPGPQPADHKASLSIASRNLKALTLRAYKVPLDTVLTSAKKLADPDARFSQFTPNFGPLSEAQKLGPKVAEWTYPTGDKGDYQGHNETITTPLSEPGAYLVEADGDDGQVRSAAIVLITDLAVMKKTDKDNVLCFVADARSGHPTPNAAVVVRQFWQNGYDNVNNKPINKVQVTRGVTDADGLVSVPTVKHPNGQVQIEAFASAPGSRYALTSTGYWYDYGNNNTPNEIKVYAYTDRPVYRPKQTVYFRDLLAKRIGGSDFTPLVKDNAHVWVRSPKGDTIFDQTFTSSEFGTVNGSFVLPSGAPLGEYEIICEAPTNTVGSCRFRVEEYKKPEYLVKVTPSAAQARFGDKVSATIQATYYSGPPVAGAKVSYRVFRNPFYPNYRFPQPYDWFYQQDNGDYTNQNADQGELVTKGEGVTDAKGALEVNFVADKGTRGYGGDYAYTVMANVVDSSRRQISGEGILHVTNQAFYAYLNVPNGFYQRGDKVQIELRTQNADEQPVPVTGLLTVSRLTYDNVNHKEIADVVSTQDVTTDADGKAFTTWQTDKSGQYRIEFKARDKFEKQVVASAPVWVEGDDLNDRQFHVGGITLLTDKTTYEQGETAHLLIVSDQPDNWVLLTSESGNQILTHTLVHVVGQAKTLDIPIVRSHVPNFALAAVAVRDYQFYRWQQELFVPPTRQFLHVAVKADKPEYKPGETGTFHVTTTNYLGQPVASEVSLAVVDSSVFYIQKEYAQDIRLFYYGQRRNINVNLDSSDAGRIDPGAESDFRTEDYKPHGIHLPELGRLPGEYYQYYYGPFYYNSFDRRVRITGEANVIFRGDSSRRDVGGIAFSQPYSGSAGFGGGVMSSPGAPISYYDSNGVTQYALKSASRREAGILSLSDAIGDVSEDKKALLNGQVPYAQAQVRRNFADTAFWTPAVVTSKTDGQATMTVHFPDTLTTWKATARGLTPGVQVGAGDTQAITNKHLLVRLEAPRFFVERDKVTLSAIVRNDLATDKQVRVSLTTSGGVLEPTPGASADPSLLGKGEDNGGLSSPTPPSLLGKGAGGLGSRLLTVPAHSEKRVDWTESVIGDGQATVKMTAETDKESDAVEQSFPALTYGVQKFLTTSGVLQKDQNTATLTVAIPKEHKAGSSALLVQINPSLAATTLDALPYLADYPYGCVEQTLSRFLPSVIVAKTLRDAGVNLDTLHTRALAMQEREQTGTPFGQSVSPRIGGGGANTAQTGYTYPHGTPGVMKTPMLAPELPFYDRYTNPVFNPETLKSMTDDGLSRLVSMQRGDGGWGWWGGSAESDPYMSAYVAYGLATAKQAGVAVPGDVLARGYAYLASDVKDRDDAHGWERNQAVWECFALSQDPAAFPANARHIVHIQYGERDKLSAYGQALLALTLHNLGESDAAAVVCRNLQNTATVDTENGTASWKPHFGYWWDWYNDDVETDAWALKAYVAVLPQSDLTPMLVKWLVQNQRGSVWHSTKETAMAVYALTDYIKANNELAPDYTVTIKLGDRISRVYKINRDNALLFDNRFLVPDTLLTDGDQTVTITKQGSGRLYYSSAVQYFTTEEKIAASGTELKIQRRYFKLTPKTKSVADYEGGTFNVLDYNRAELADGASLKSGDLIEVELVLDSKNEYDYCCFEDMKPAGCEPIDLRSGGNYGDGLCSDMELRDTKTAFFVDHLPQGTRVLRYRLRAEVPGAFHALPTNGYAMYAPDVRALSDSWHVTVSDEVQMSRVGM